MDSIGFCTKLCGPSDPGLAVVIAKAEVGR